MLGARGENGDKLVKKELIVTFKGKIYFVKFIINPEEDDIEIGVILGRSFMRLTKGIADFRNGVITIYPELDPFLDNSEETKKFKDDWELILNGINFGQSLNNEKPLTQEEAAREAIAIDIYTRFSILEEAKPVIETMAYSDKYKKILDKNFLDKQKLDGKIKQQEEEEAVKRVMGEALKEKDNLAMLGARGENGDKLVKKELIVALRGKMYFVKFIINPEEDDIETGVILGRSFMQLTKGIADFRNGVITIYPELDPFLDNSEETKKFKDDWELILNGINFREIPDIDKAKLPPFYVKWEKKMAPKRRTTRLNPGTTHVTKPSTTTTSVTNAQLQAMIDEGVNAALAARDTTRNGDDSHTLGTGARRPVQTARECSYSEFLKCKPLDFKGTEGVVELTRWAPARVYAVGNTGANPDNVIAGTFLLNNHCALILFDTGADKSFVSTAFSSLININPSTLDCSYDVELANDQIVRGNGCFECGAQGHFKRNCLKLKNNDRGNQAGNNRAPARVYAVGNARVNPDNVVAGTFLLNNHCALILFNTGADKSFVSTAFSSLININPSTLDCSYDVELANGQIVGVNTVIRGFTLNLLNHPFNIDLMSV
nr:reverse transcriptase domain-containing protein [Tanacetum cinerariifolium]